MQLFAVFGTTDPGGAFAMAVSKYGVNCRRVDDQSFLVAAQGLTTQDVASSVGLDPQRGVVVQFSGYYGFHDRGLWEWIDLKARSDG